MKTRNERDIPLVPVLRDVLARIVGERRSGPIFQQRRASIGHESPLAARSLRELEGEVERRLSTAIESQPEQASKREQRKVVTQTIWRDLGALQKGLGPQGVDALLLPPAPEEEPEKPRAILRMATADLHALATALQMRRLGPPFSAFALQGYIGKESSEVVAASLQSLHETGLSGEQLGVMLDVLAQDRSSRREVADSVDLVTTGPEARGVANRDTSVVVREMFAQAEDSVLVAGYAIYQGQRVFQALAQRMKERPNLKVRLFLDVQRKNGNTSMAAEIVRQFAARFRTQQWPQGFPFPSVFYDPRSLDQAGTKRACLHAKCVVVDGQHVFVSSANFTEAAQERNVEVGLLVHSASVAMQLAGFFDALHADGLLVPLP